MSGKKEAMRDEAVEARQKSEQKMAADLAGDRVRRERESISKSLDADEERRRLTDSKRELAKLEFLVEQEQEQQQKPKEHSKMIQVLVNGSLAQRERTASETVLVPFCNFQELGPQPTPPLPEGLTHASYSTALATRVAGEREYRARLPPPRQPGIIEVSFSERESPAAARERDEKVS